jgi:hypothetical protein
MWKTWPFLKGRHINLRDNFPFSLLHTGVYSIFFYESASSAAHLAQLSTRLLSPSLRIGFDWILKFYFYPLSVNVRCSFCFFFSCFGYDDISDALSSSIAVRNSFHKLSAACSYLCIKTPVCTSLYTLWPQNSDSRLLFFLVICCCCHNIIIIDSKDRETH